MSKWTDKDWEKDEAARREIKKRLRKALAEHWVNSFMAASVVLFIIVVVILKLLEWMLGG